MQRTEKFISFFVAMMFLYSPCAFAKKTVHNPPDFFKLIMHSDEKYENPELKEKLSQIKAANSDSQNSSANEEFKKYDFESNERDIFKSCFAWIAIICVSLIIIKTICGNFKIPFDYDPNFKSKHTPQKKNKNKTYNFQKR